mgnify:CR=1 FL=1
MHAAPALHGLTILERGWLSSNNVLLHGSEGSPAWLVDSGHVRHAGQTVALVRHALRGEPLAGLLNTHLHSDHCGGNAAVQRAFGCRIHIPPGHWDAARDWNEQTLSYRPTGQQCERFVPDARMEPGQVLHIDAGGTRRDYIADICRMGCIGEPGPLARELHAACLEVQAAARAVIRAGVPCRDVLRLCRPVFCPQTRHPAEVTLVSRQEDQVARKGNRRNAQIHGGDSDMPHSEAVQRCSRCRIKRQHGGVQECLEDVAQQRVPPMRSPVVRARPT